MSNLHPCETFLRNDLMPAAFDQLRRFYEDYKAGRDLDIQTKSDDSPASRADRETEQSLRDIIMARFPEHGIWGEELGAYNIENDYVWVLDPLDGTREFLARKDHCFGCLIGLCYKGMPIIGGVGNPINNRMWTGEKVSPPPSKTLSQAALSCTNPKSMFKKETDKNFIDKIIAIVSKTITGLNCLGFTGVATGDIDLVIEQDLKLHDITPLLPVLKNSGVKCFDLAGQNYLDIKFNLQEDQNKTFSIIASQNETIVQEVLSLFQERKLA